MLLPPFLPPLNDNAIGAIYSDDSDVRGYACEAGMDAYQLSDLPPPEDPQKALPFVT